MWFFGSTKAPGSSVLRIGGICVMLVTVTRMV
jgi:hypothetical protein